jgi:CBS-domain-containing membrane protein
MSGTHTDTPVSDLMTREVVTCPPDANLAAVATLLARRDVYAVFVISDTGEPSGVVSDFDLLAGEWLGDDARSFETMQTLTAGEMMTSPVETIAESASAGEAAARLREEHLSRLLVIDASGAAVGVITTADLIKPFGQPSTDRRTVRDVMSYAIVTCLPETPLGSAARAMVERHSRSIIVVDETGRAVGVITGHDVLSLYEPTEARETVAELMKAPLITAAPDLALTEAANLMIGSEVHRLVVVDPERDDGAPIGIVSTSDIVAEMAGDRSAWQRTRA